MPPAPLGSNRSASVGALESADSVTPPPAAAAVIFSPVEAADDARVSTVSAGHGTSIVSGSATPPPTTSALSLWLATNTRVVLTAYTLVSRGKAIMRSAGRRMPS